MLFDSAIDIVLQPVLPLRRNGGNPVDLGIHDFLAQKTKPNPSKAKTAYHARNDRDTEALREMVCFRNSVSLLALAAVAWSSSAPILAAAELPNVVVILADDVGYGDLSCYGATKVATPNLDRMAASGMRFVDCHSAAAVCTPSRYALLTGQYAWRHRPASGILNGVAPLCIPSNRMTVAQLLQRAGYDTAAIGRVVEDGVGMFVVAEIGQQPAGLGLVGFRIEHRHGRVVGVNLLGRFDLVDHPPIDRRQQRGTISHPAAHRMARQFDADASEDSFQAIQRQMVGVLADRNVGEQ